MNTKKEKNMKITETYGDVIFYENEKGKLFQSIDGGDNIFPVKNGKVGYKHIKKVGEVSIKYDLCGCYGFSIFSKTGICLEDRIWTMKEAEETAWLCNPNKTLESSKKVSLDSKISEAREKKVQNKGQNSEEQSHKKEDVER